MKNILKLIKPKPLIISIYITLVWGIFLYLNTNDFSLILIYIFICSYILFNILINKFRNISISSNYNPNKKTKVFLLAFLLTLIIMIIWLLAYYPGSFSWDSIVQYNQAISNSYNDWHPVLHTFLFFTIPLILTNCVGSIIVFQMIYFSLAIAYTTSTIYELSNFKFAVITWLLIILNPYVGHINLYPWKDVAFGIGGLISLVIAIRLIVFKNKEVRLWKIIVFGLLLTCTTILRHNAILYTAPLLICLFLKIDKKVCSKILIVALISFFVIKGPVYSSLGVTSQSKSVVETTGLPLTIIGNVAKETPELMDKELSEFVYSIATPEQWDTYYTEGNFNSIKQSTTTIDLSAVEKQGFFGMARLMFKCFKLSPKASFRAFFALTDVVYGFENGLEGDVGANIVSNTVGINYTSNGNIVRTLLWFYSACINHSFLKVIRTYGVYLLALLFFALNRLNFKSWNSWKNVLIAFPIFIYDFGTMLLLTGPDSRFFYLTFLITPLLICYLLYIKKEEQ